MENLLIAENIRSFHPEAGPVLLALASGDRCYLQGSEVTCNTLFEMLIGLKKPDEGTVTVLGQNPYTMPETERAAFRRDHIGAVPKGGGFLPELTLLEQVRLPMILAGLSGDEIRSRIRKNALPLSLNVVIPQPEAPSTEPSDPTAPTMSTDPTAPTNPTEPSIPQIPTVLEIDSSHIYSGMDMAYEDGYLPRISGGVMKIVLPLKCSGSLWGDKLDTSISLDTSASSPFVVENFRKTFYLESVTPKNSSESQKVYLVTYEIQLSDERRNGTYPVTITTSGFDASGNAITTTFTLYITITDGKIEKIAQPVVDTPTAEPVVYISKTVLEPTTAQAGESFTMTVTLKNSITTKYVRNMLVTVDTGNVQIDLEDGL